MFSNTPHKRVGERTVGSPWVAHISGVHMLKRLGDEDRRAVDLLLDRSSGTGQLTMYAAPGQNVLSERVRSVEALLRVLDEMPADDPPADLAARTLSLIEHRAYAAPAPHAEAAPTPQPAQTKPHV